jgi:hypothetical protein
LTRATSGGPPALERCSFFFFRDRDSGTALGLLDQTIVSGVRGVS